MYQYAEVASTKRAPTGNLGEATIWEWRHMTGWDHRRTWLIEYSLLKYTVLLGVLLNLVVKFKTALKCTLSNISYAKLQYSISKVLS